MKKYQTAVVGAGASGLLAALTAAGPGGVLLLEGNEKPARKLLATGNGRCNLTNANISPTHYHGDTELAGVFLNRWPTERILKQFRELGLLTRADNEGRFYPNSLQAAAVSETLLTACEEAGVHGVYGFRVEKLSREKFGFKLTAADGREVLAERCILACGGMASPKHSTGSGYELARQMGHSVTELTPSLVGLRVQDKAARALKGMRCKARAALCREEREVYAESGEVIFGDGSVSGICVMNLSARIRDLPRDKLSLRLDLIEAIGLDQLTSYLADFCRIYPKRSSRELFSGVLNLRVGQELAKQLGLDGPLSRLKPKQLMEAAQLAKAFTLQVAGTLKWDQAQVTAGGVPLSELDLRTMESRRCPGLYLTGELLNLDGDCGGYNLHWAWATGLAAGAACRKIRRKGGNQDD